MFRALLHACPCAVRLSSGARANVERTVQDPMIRKRILQLLVAFSTTALDKNAPFMLKVLEHILMTWPSAQPTYKAYNEAIKELQSESLVELQRLASKMPDHLLVSCRAPPTPVYGPAKRADRTCTTSWRPKSRR